jgi:hypothetical protein
MKAQEVLAAVLQPIIYLVQESSNEEYESLILPAFRYASLIKVNTAAELLKTTNSIIY